MQTQKHITYLARELAPLALALARVDSNNGYKLGLSSILSVSFRFGFSGVFGGDGDGRDEGECEQDFEHHDDLWIG